MELQIKALIIAVIVVISAFIIPIAVVYGTMPDQPNLRHRRPCHLQTAEDPLGCTQTPGNFSRQMIKEINQEFDRLSEAERTDAEHETPIGLRGYLETHFLEMKPSIKLIPGIQVPRDKDVMLEMVPIRQWKTDGELTDNGGFVRNGMRVQSGRILIPTNGFYNVYSFTSLFVSAEQDKNTTSIKQQKNPIKHAIYKYNILDGDEVELVSSEQLQKSSSNKYFNVYTSFLTTVVHLNAGDELSMKLNNVTHMRFPEKSYFGANFV